MTPLELPPNLDSEAIEDIYYVPPIDQYAQPPQEFEVPRPQALVAGEFEDLIKIQTLDQRQWILVRLLPGQVWPRLKDFLLASGVGVAREDGNRGIVETPWASQPLADLQERYRYRVVQGLQRNTAEVHLLQMQREPAPRDVATDWPANSDDIQRERATLEQFARYLADTADVNAAVSLMGQGIDTSRRLYLASGGDPAILAKVDRDRGWASLAYAVDKAGFRVLQQDAAAGTMLVSLDPQMQPADKGMWQRFYEAVKPGDETRAMEEFRFRLTMKPASEPGWMEIRIANPDTDTSDPQVQQQMLGLIKGYLT
jgi:outer membrane protein assembly factor BamC